MDIFGSPVQVATIASAALLPLVAGTAVVLWSKARSALRARQIAAMQGQLQNMYRSLEAQPVPARLAQVIEALIEGDELTPASASRAARRARAHTSPPASR